ncbi:MAG: ABC transporter ATP-binding protein [Clostridiales bacterium]|jgi:putative ABC transport system ATP-binding protein|nr:ABC transporter ATP-binding protein [Clostridiales bacterium]MDR2749343.1 ABC transporter ATP-binding protein [Clostridiales bacterium]
MTCLELKSVSYRYGGARDLVLDGISASFEMGKVYAITGESGSGKSTLLSLMSGLDICGSGDILYMGKSLRDIDRDAYRAKSAGVVFQSFNLLLNSTALYNVTLSMGISGIPLDSNGKKMAAQALLEKVGVNSATASRKVLKLSGGEQQRVGIARALSHNPDVVIADEPTGNLDAETESAILKIFADVAHGDGKCVILVTHSESVTAMADEVFSLCDGKLAYGEAKREDEFGL